MFRIERMLLELGARPDRRGYEQTVVALAVLLQDPQERSVQRIYQRAGDICGLSAEKIEDGVRQTVRCIWKHQREIGDLPLKLDARVLQRYEPSNKEFLYFIATQLQLRGVDHPIGL